MRHAIAAHAIAAGDANEAKHWLEQCAMELVKKGDLQPLLSWQRLFPVELKQSQIKGWVSDRVGFGTCHAF